jgi:alpha-tubulin suppressor-like RCC1 family protein
MKLLSLLFVAGVVWFRGAADSVFAQPLAAAVAPQFAALAATPLALPGPDLDADGLSDLQELRIGTNPTKPDTDGDGFSDGQEYQLRTNPLVREQTPLFLLSTNFQQHLLGETLVIRPTLLTNFILVTNVLITNIPPVYEGTPVDSDGDGEPDSCDVDGDGVADGFELCPITTPGSTKTNTTVVTNYIQFQWFAGTNSLPTQTNANLVLLNVGTRDAGTYRLEAALLTSSQASDDVPVQVFPLAPRVPLPVAGKVVAWGGNLAGQTLVPPDLTNVIQVAAGFLHSMALRADGSVAAWGDSGLDQIDVPSDLLEVSAIASGAAHGLGLQTNGTVRGWGSDAYGQATPPADLTQVVAIAAGYFHSVAVRADGSVVSWGDSTYGQTNVPANLPPVLKVAAGMFHTLALTADGTVVCWGANDFGQCSPAAVADQLHGVVDLAAGDNHSVALRRDGIVLAWGDDSAGQVTVPNNLPKAVAISAGFKMTGAVTHENKLVLWGDPTLPKPPLIARPAQWAGGYFHLLAIDAIPDPDGDRLDDRREEAAQTSKSQRDTDRDGVLDGIEVRLGSNPNLADTEGDGLSDLLEFTYGFDASVATEAPAGSLKAGPAVELEFFASGRTVFQLQGSGDGSLWSDLAGPFTPRRGITRVLTNAAPGLNQYRLLPVARADGDPRPDSGPPEPLVIGTVRAFGNNELGQLEFPARIADVVRVAAGVWHTLGLHSDGSVVAWGLNSSGQSEVPAELGQVIALAGGGAHSLAVRPSGEVIGWGGNTAGQLNVPELGAPATTVAAGGSHSLALLNDGSVVAWGANESGQTDVPAGLANVMAVVAGRFHSVALREDGSVVAWGDNRLGQASVPAALPPVAGIAAGFGHTVAVTREGRVYCWGNDADGQARVPAGLSGVVAVYAGNTVTVARTGAGLWVVWGRDAESLAAQLNNFGATASLAVGGSHLVAVNSPVDADFDGVDDAFERILGSSTESSDSDGDGLDEQTEILAGFSPTEASESADGAVKTHAALQLKFFTLAGETYQLERSPDYVTWRPEGALRPAARFANRNGFTELLLSVLNRDAQVWRLLKVDSVVAP